MSTRIDPRKRAPKKRRCIQCGRQVNAGRLLIDLRRLDEIALGVVLSIVTGFAVGFAFDADAGVIVDSPPAVGQRQIDTGLQRALGVMSGVKIPANDGRVVAAQDDIDDDRLTLQVDVSDLAADPLEFLDLIGRDAGQNRRRRILLCARINTVDQDISDCRNESALRTAVIDLKTGYLLDHVERGHRLIAVEEVRCINNKLLAGHRGTLLIRLTGSLGGGRAGRRQSQPTGQKSSLMRVVAHAFLDLPVSMLGGYPCDEAGRNFRSGGNQLHGPFDGRPRVLSGSRCRATTDRHSRSARRSRGH